MNTMNTDKRLTIVDAFQPFIDNESHYKELKAGKIFNLRVCLPSSDVDLDFDDIPEQRDRVRSVCGYADDTGFHLLMLIDDEEQLDLDIPFARKRESVDNWHEFLVDSIRAYILSIKAQL